MRINDKLIIVAREIFILAIVGVVISCLFLWWENSQQSSTQTIRAGREPEGPLTFAGDKIELSQVSTSQGLMVVVTSPGCVFCRRSEEFHRRLLMTAKQFDLATIAVVDDPSSARDFLSRIGRFDHVLPMREVSLRVQGTPTVVLIGGDRLVRRMWTGKVPAAIEAEIIGEVRAGNQRGETRGVSSAGRNLQFVDVERLARNGTRFQIVDINERQNYRSRSGSINIPLLELASRAPFELDATALTVVDCSNAAQSACDAAILNLDRLGITGKTLASGSIYQSCSYSEVRK